MTKYEQIKFWAKNHQDIIVIVGVGTVVIGLVIVGIRADISYREQLSSELNTYIDELNSLYQTQAV